MNTKNQKVSKSKMSTVKKGTKLSGKGKESRKNFAKEANKRPAEESEPGDNTKVRNTEMVNAKQVIKTDGVKWYQLEDRKKASKDEENQANHDEEESKPLLDSELKELESKASEYLEADTSAYINASVKGHDRNDFLWMNKVMKTGTLPDRMAAYTVRIQDSPVHNIQCLEQLIAQVKTQGKQQCLMTAETVKDLFLQDLLPPSRKLMSFGSHGEALRKATKKQLIIMLYEDRLKNCYGKFVNALGKMANDTVEKLRGKAISIIQQLLTDHGEQEQALLQMLVNKLGDPAQKVASRALFHLNKVVKAHPRMKKVVVEEVERLLFRNNIGKKAQYYGICFLNLLHIEDDHPQLAVKLIKVYLAFFKACVKKGEIDSKLMSALLLGVNKAFPRSQMIGFELSESIDTLYKIVRMAQFNVGLQALALLLQIVNVKEDQVKADRYYRILYEKVLSPEVATTAHGMKLLNLLYKALQADVNIRRVTAFGKRLLQICHHVPANIACAILYLLSEVSKTHRGMFKLGGTVEQKNDSSTAETSQDEEVTETNSSKNLATLLKKTNVIVDSEIVRPAQGSIAKLDEVTLPKAEKREPVKTKADCDNEDDVKEVKQELRATEYDMNARNPSYCGAELALSCELTSLEQHYHPSVALFAKTLLSRQFIKYDGNPLKDFTVARFLERFIYKNPKVNKLHANYEPRGLRKFAVNSSEYLTAGESQIPVDEQFFYQYFKGKKHAQKVKKTEEEESDNESIGDEEFDEIMNGYFKSHGVSPEDDDEADEVDFAADAKSLNKKSKGRKRSMDDEEEDGNEDEDEDGDIDLDDMEGAYEDSDLDGEEAIDADDFVELGDDDDGFDLDADMEDDEDVDFDGEIESQVKPKKPKKAGKGTFVPAEQFADMLDDNADFDIASSHTFVNKDRADMKQIKWETDRDRWVKGYKKSSRTTFKSQKSKRRKLK